MLRPLEPPQIPVPATSGQALAAWPLPRFVPAPFFPIRFQINPVGAARPLVDPAGTWGLPQLNPRRKCTDI
jgi:hypothetical protein